MISCLLILLVVPLSISNILENSYIPVISNLNSQIDIFAAIRCYISLDNHLGINLLPFNYPVTLRDIPKLQTTNRRTSKFFYNVRDLSNSYSVPSLNFFQYTSNHKTWKCLVHLHLYPSLDARNFFLYPNVFHYEVSPYSKTFELIEPSVVPKVHILIFKASIQELERARLKRLWKNSSKYSRRDSELFDFYSWINAIVLKRHYTNMVKPLLTTNIFLVGSTEFVSENLAYANEEVTKLVRIEQCGFCNSHMWRNPALKRKIVKLNSILPELQGYTITSETSNTFWNLENLEHSVKNDRLFFGIATHLDKCENKLGKAKSFADVSFQNKHDLMFHGLASLLQDSMTNYTYKCNGRYRNCLNGKTYERFNNWDVQADVHLVSRGHPSQYSVYQILTIPEQVTNLKFVSCGGDRGTRLFPFLELFTVYDNYIWVLILISSFAIHWVITKIPKNTMYSYKQNELTLKYLLNTLKVLLEQGDPFPSSVASTLNLRYAIGSFLLVGIVLSNAYKSENVYNMITLRKEIPYERFHELVDNNFTIYSRSSFIYFDSDLLWLKTRGAFPSLSAITPHFLSIPKSRFTALSVTSEVFEWKKSSFTNDSVHSTWNEILANTRLHPLVGEVAASLFYPHTKWQKYDKIVDEIRNDVWNQENDLLQKFLSECNRAAVVAPEVIVNRFGKHLQRNNTPNVYVGKETYSNVTFALELKGWVQPIVLKRIRCIKESGLWEWWPKFIQTSKDFILQKSFKSLEDSKPNMSGNILQIFLMFVGGLAFASILFALEIRKSVGFLIVLHYCKYWVFTATNVVVEYLLR